MSVKWIESGGGPLVLMNSSLAKKWRGINGSSTGAVLTDYLRACEVEEDVGIIPTGEGSAVVLGDEPDRAALVRHEGVVYILRWRWASSAESLLQSFAKNIGNMEFSGHSRFLTKSGRHILFDSACEIIDGCECLEIDLNSDSFDIESTLFKPDKNLCALVHRMRVF